MSLRISSLALATITIRALLLRTSLIPKRTSNCPANRTTKNTPSWLANRGLGTPMFAENTTAKPTVQLGWPGRDCSHFLWPHHHLTAFHGKNSMEMVSEVGGGPSLLYTQQQVNCFARCFGFGRFSPESFSDVGLSGCKVKACCAFGSTCPKGVGEFRGNPAFGSNLGAPLLPDAGPTHEIAPRSHLCLRRAPGRY